LRWGENPQTRRYCVANAALMQNLITNYELRITNYELRITNYELFNFRFFIDNLS
jgi:hypothetical protein